MGPGYGIDTCSTGHTLMLQNPIIRADELGLVEKYGLSYLHPDPVAHVALPDGEQITMSLDCEATMAELARYSEKDAQSYGRLIAEFDELRPLLGKARSGPIGMAPSMKSLLAEHPRGGIWARRMAMSARDIILREFESPHVRAFMGWLSFQTAVPIDQAGTGILPYQIAAPRQASSWSIPKGGSGRLTDALVGFLGDHGVTFYCNATVARLILDDGRCVGVETNDGRAFRAKQGVVSTIHVKHLADMAPATRLGVKISSSEPIPTMSAFHSLRAIWQLLRRRSLRLHAARARRSRQGMRDGSRISFNPVAISTTSACRRRWRGCWLRRQRWLIPRARRKAITRSSF